MDELQMIDYVTKPLSEIRKHPSFSLEAFLKVTEMLGFNTTKIENLDITGVTNG